MLERYLNSPVARLTSLHVPTIECTTLFCMRGHAYGSLASYGYRTLLWPHECKRLVLWSVFVLHTATVMLISYVMCSSSIHPISLFSIPGMPTESAHFSSLSSSSLYLFFPSSCSCMRSCLELSICPHVSSLYNQTFFLAADAIMLNLVRSAKSRKQWSLNELTHIKSPMSIGKDS